MGAAFGRLKEGRARRRAAFAFLAASGATACGALAFGFLIFVLALPQPGRATPQRLEAAARGVPVPSRGIVALTGGGGLRIDAAIALQQAGLAPRVLISGVNPQITKADLDTEETESVFACCVDLGVYARTTKGNAFEARSWLRSHDYRLVFLVTSNFHLPRASAELRKLAPELTVIGVPVDSRTVPERGWPASPRAWVALLEEYAKLLIVSTRQVVAPR